MLPPITQLSLPSPFPRTPSSPLAARAALYTFSLVSQNINQGYLVLHQLLQDVERARLSSTPYKPVFETALMLLVRALPNR